MPSTARVQQPDIASSPHGRSAPQPPSTPRALPLAELVLVEALLAAGVVAAILAGTRGWYGATAAALLVVVALVPVAGATLPRWTATRTGYERGRRRRRRERDVAEPFDADLGDGAQIGFRWDGRTLLSVVEINANPQALTVMEPGVTVSGETVPVQVLVDCLRQFDIEVASIDVISQGVRSHGHGHIAAIYDAVIGPLPAIAQRTVWVVVRFDPASCADAVRHRGGGRDGILRAATSATRRIANRLSAAGLRPSILTAGQVVHATNQLCDGVNVHTVEETWRMCREGGFQMRTFAVQPERLTTAGLGMLWTVPSYSTTIGLSLRRDARGELEVRGLVRFDSHRPLPTRLPGLGELRGRQHAALVATLPLPSPRRSLGRWATALGDGSLAELVIPASGCGQVVGADEHGRAVALPLFGPQLARVEVSGTLHLAQQAVLRSLALGARVRVHTRRPHAWHDMVGAVADPNAMRVTDPGRGTMAAGAERNYSIEVFDGVAEQPVRVGVTAVVVMPRGSAPSADADVSLELLDRDLVRVGTRAGTAVVTMVATDDEMRYLRASFTTGD
jgi:type VII secretion protein EccE